MADGTGSNQENEDKDQSGVAEPTRKNARKKIRPTYSCLQCHKRKVKVSIVPSYGCRNVLFQTDLLSLDVLVSFFTCFKLADIIYLEQCDRVKPCGACCLRGTPSECEYGNSKQDRHYIEQSTLIENLLQSCETLKQQLEDARKQANLPPVKQEDDSSTQLPHDLSSSDTRSSGKHEDSRALVHSGTQTETQSDDIPESLSPLRTSSGAVPIKAGMSIAQHGSGGTCNNKVVASNSVFLTRCIAQSPQNLLREKKNLSDPALARALMELFVERLIREFSPADASNFGGTIRLREAAEMRVFSPMLCNAFEAASLTFAGSRQQNRSLEMVGHARYIRMLRQLQNALYHPEKSQATDALVVVLLSTIIEVSLGQLDLSLNSSLFH